MYMYISVYVNISVKYQIIYNFQFKFIILNCRYKCKTIEFEKQQRTFQRIKSQMKKDKKSLNHLLCCQECLQNWKKRYIEIAQKEIFDTIDIEENFTFNCMHCRGVVINYNRVHYS